MCANLIFRTTLDYLLKVISIHTRAPGSPSYFFISDTFFCNLEVAKKRGFNRIHEFHSEMTYRWNKTVKKDDIVVVVGGFINTQRKETMKRVLSRLNGNKVIIYGESDKNDPQTYRECGFDFAVRHGIEMVLTDGINEIKCLVQTYEPDQKKGFLSSIFEKKPEAVIISNAINKTREGHIIGVTAESRNLYPIDIRQLYVEVMEAVKCTTQRIKNV